MTGSFILLFLFIFVHLCEKVPLTTTQVIRLLNQVTSLTVFSDVQPLKHIKKLVATPQITQAVTHTRTIFSPKNVEVSN